MIPVEKSKAKANPTKAFFVRMITRDISLEDCIFDLIDNSIDGAWELAGGGPMRLDDETDLSRFKIQIQIDENRFEISDNCGGITLDEAVDYAFTFGRKENARVDDYSIGVYGIGMKRAVFKIGKKIEIRSTYNEDNKLSSYSVPIDVDEWLKLEDSREWDFDIVEAKHLEQAGVKIIVEDLTEVAQSSFGSPEFILDLERAIARDYAMHLNRGLKIEVQGKLISEWNIEFRQSEEFIPMRITYHDQCNEQPVHVEILAGMSAPPPDSNEPSEQPSAEPNRDGWYIVCNGRIVLAADKTTITGWGTSNFPQWHPQYTGFMGIILFSSPKANALPLTTTKRNVDESSAIYRRSIKYMRDTTKKWIAYTNARKTKREEAAIKEKKALAIAISEVSYRENIGLPKLNKEGSVKEATVFYAVRESRLRKLAIEFGNINMTNKDVGLKSFEHAYEEFVGEE